MLWPSMRCGNLAIFVRHVLPTLVIAILASPGLASGAVHTVSYSNAVDPPIVVADGDLDDFDMAADKIEVHFTLADPIADDWVASGIIYASTTDPAGATLVVTSTTIQNVTGNQVGATIIVSHDFPPLVSFTQQYVAHIDGSFDKVGGGLLGNLLLNWGASITGNSLGNQAFPGGLVQAPQFFDWTGLPKHEDTVTKQTETFMFYMDELDNTINLFDSATILPVTTVGVDQRSWGVIKGLYR